MHQQAHAAKRSHSITGATMAKSGAADLRIKKLHGPHMVRVSSDHNLRKNYCPYVYASRVLSHQSARIETLHGSDDPLSVAAAARQRRDEAGVKKLRKNQVVALEIMVTLRPGSCHDESAYFQQSLEWVAGNFGGWANVLAAVVHNDEGAPHMHVLVVPVVGSRMVGSALVGGPGRLRALRSSFNSEVCAAYGLSMPAGALRGDDKHNASSAVLRRIEMNDDPVRLSGVWTTVQDQIRRDPRPFMLDLGIDQEQFRPQRRLRSSTQTFTGKGKGPQYRREGDAP